MQAQARSNTPASEHTSGEAMSQRFKLHSIQEVLALPPPDWLIRDVLTVGSQAVLFGPTGSGKSFVALDMALSIATGQCWQGLDVRQGPVAYVVAEGGQSVSKRVDAWIQHQGLAPIDEMFFVLEPVQLKNPAHIQALVGQISLRNKQPVLLVFDTLARCFVDGEENSAKDVGVLVHQAGLLQQETRASVLIVHHTGREGGHERGSTALGGAADVMISQTIANGIITLRNTKQKDAEEFARMTLQLHQVQLQMSESLTSCVVLPADAPADADQGGGDLNVGQRRLLAVLFGCDDDGLTGREWRAAVAAEPGIEIPERTFQRWRQGLVQQGLVERTPGGNPPRYRLTPDGHVRATGMPA